MQAIEANLSNQTQKTLNIFSADRSPIIQQELESIEKLISNLYGDPSHLELVLPNIINNNGKDIENDPYHILSNAEPDKLKTLKFDNNGLIKSQDVDKILSSISKISELLKTKKIVDLKVELDICYQLIKLYINNIKKNTKNSLAHKDTQNYINFWVSIGNKIKIINQEILEPSLEDILGDYLKSNVKSFKALSLKILNWISESKTEENKKTSTLTKMKVDWDLIESIQSEKLSLNDLDDFASKILNSIEKSPDFDKIKNVLAGIFSMIISYFNNPINNIDDQLNLPKTKDQLFKILKSNSINPGVLEPLHHILNYLELDDRENILVLNTMSTRHLRDSKICIALLGFYHRLQASSPENAFFKEQKDISNTITKILEDLKNQDLSKYEQFVDILTGLTSPNKLPSDLNQKFVQINNLISRLIIDPNIYESKLLDENHSRIGVEAEGPFQPDQTRFDPPKIPIVLPPKQYNLGYDGTGHVQELRTDFTDISQAKNASLGAYIQSVPGLIRFIQTNYNMFDSVLLSATHIHYDKIIHSNIPKIWTGWDKHGNGIVGKTWESRAQSLTAFTAPEYFIQFLYSIISCQDKPKPQEVIEILKGNLTPYLFRNSPVSSLLMNANQNRYNVLISNYVSADEIINLYKPAERSEIIKSAEFSQLGLDFPETILEILSSNKIRSDIISFSELTKIIEYIDFEKLSNRKKIEYSLIIYKFSTKHEINSLGHFIKSFFQKYPDVENFNLLEASLVFLVKNGDPEIVLNIINQSLSSNISQEIAKNIDINQLDQETKERLQKQNQAENSKTIVNFSTLLTQFQNSNNSKELLELIKSNLITPELFNSAKVIQKIEMISLLTKLVEEGCESIIFDIIQNITNSDNIIAFKSIITSFKDKEILIKSAKLIEQFLPFLETTETALFQIFIQNSTDEQINNYYLEKITEENFTQINYHLRLLADNHKPDLILNLINKYGNEKNAKVFKAAIINLLQQPKNERVIEIISKYYNPNNSSFYAELIDAFDDTKQYTELFQILEIVLNPSIIVSFTPKLRSIVEKIKSDTELESFIRFIKSMVDKNNHLDFIEIYTILAKKGKNDLVKSFVSKYANIRNIGTFGKILFSLAQSNEIDFVVNILDQNLDDKTNIAMFKSFSEILLQITVSNREDWVLNLIQKYKKNVDISDIDIQNILRSAIKNGKEEKVFNIIKDLINADNFQYLYDILNSFKETKIRYEILEIVKNKYAISQNNDNDRLFVFFLDANCTPEELESFIDQKITNSNFANFKIGLFTLVKKCHFNLVTKLIKKLGSKENSSVFKTSLAKILEQGVNTDVIFLIQEFIDSGDKEFYEKLIDNLVDQKKYSILLEVLNQTLLPGKLLIYLGRIESITQSIKQETEIQILIKILDKNINKENFIQFSLLITHIADSAPQKALNYILDYVNEQSLEYYSEAILKLSEKYGMDVFQDKIENGVTEKNFKNLYNLILEYSDFNPEKAAKIVAKYLNRQNIIFFKKIISYLAAQNQFDIIRESVLKSIKGDINMIKLIFEALFTSKNKKIVSDIIYESFELSDILKSNTLEFFRYLDTEYSLKGKIDIFASIVELIEQAISQNENPNPSDQDLSALYKLLKENSSYFTIPKHTVIADYLDDHGYGPLTENLNIYRPEKNFE